MTIKPIRRRGAAIVYSAVALFTLCGFAAVATDWGHMQLVKMQLQSAADSAARYGAAGLQNDLSGVSAAYANAAASVAQNKADGNGISFNVGEDVEIGFWSTSLRTFTPTTNLDLANAVKVTTRCTQARGTGVKMMFLGFLGRPTSDVKAVSIAQIVYDGTTGTGGAGNGRYEYFIPATSNPWLSGMPSGSVASNPNPHNNPDYAGTNKTDSGTKKLGSPSRGFTTGGSTDAGSAESNYAAWGEYAAKKASPIQAGGIKIDDGVAMTFDGVNGGAFNSAGGSTVTADGGSVTSNWRNNVESTLPENGIANLKAPINSVIGIFLDDDRPNKTTAPTPLDFSTAASRNFTTLKPKLKQPFFIGDGRTSTGEVQQFIAPDGASRLFIGTMDGYEWSNNQGGFWVTAHAMGRIITVK
jgi:Flp pilus assembly protein TadG